MHLHLLRSLFCRQNSPSRTIGASTRASNSCCGAIWGGGWHALLEECLPRPPIRLLKFDDGFPRLATAASRSPHAVSPADESAKGPLRRTRYKLVGVAVFSQRVSGSSSSSSPPCTGDAMTFPRLVTEAIARYAIPRPNATNHALRLSSNRKQYRNEMRTPTSARCMGPYGMLRAHSQRLHDDMLRWLSE
jgi:hypothetical protein